MIEGHATHPGCYRDAEHGQETARFMLRHSHETGCIDRTCPGCVPCTRDEDGFPVEHCRSCRGHRAEHLRTGEHMCPRCVGRIRGELQAVLSAMALMPLEAQHDSHGVESEEFALAGPVAHLTTWQQTSIAAMRAGVPAAHLDRDERDPYFVLATWEREIRRTLGHDDYVDCSTTLAGTVGYLDSQLTTLARGKDTAAQLVQLRSQAADVRSHLEAVLHDSRGPERGAPCPICSEALGANDADPEAPRAPRLRLTRDDEDTTGASDTWTCPRNSDHTWSEADYRHRVGGDYLAHAAALTADQMHQQWRIKPSTLRTWVQRGDVKRRGKDSSGRALYDVAQARAMRDKREEAS